jgi:signal transduction histidine kinase
MKIQTRLTMIMFACLFPAGIASALLTASDVSKRQSPIMKIAAPIAWRILKASRTRNVQHCQRRAVRYSLSACDSEETAAALLNESGRPRLAYRCVPMPRDWIESRTKASWMAAEFVRQEDRSLWFCAIEPSDTGYRVNLWLAQYSKALHKVCGRWLAASLLTIVGCLLAGCNAIPVLTRRYVARQLAELHRRLIRLGGNDPPGPAPYADRALSTSEPFSCINEDLFGVPRHLLQKDERRVRDERRILNADKLAAIAKLASGFAHEVGTPLGVIRGRAEMLLEDKLEQPKVIENLEIIITQVDRISRIIRLLLDLGQSHAGIRVASDIRVIIARAIELLEPEARRRGITVIEDLGSRPLMVNCDPDQLQQVFINLGANAVEAMNPGGGILRVHSIADDQGMVRLLFDDTGPGVPAQIRDRIFEPFFTTKGGGRGAGMGLAISRAVVIAHDGELTVEQRANGARFTVILPGSSTLEPALPA